ncbi:MAG: flagellar biosynthesis anti-sigma factor FlgM [Fibrobacterota bacterium]
MELSIIQRVAKLVTSTKLESAGNDKKVPERRLKSDTVAISETGAEFRKARDAVAQLPGEDPERASKVASLREAIAKGQYRMSESMVNNIAERIARSLI